MRSSFKRMLDDEAYSGDVIYPRRTLDLKDDLVWFWTEFNDNLSEVSMEELGMEFDRLSNTPSERLCISSMVASVFSDNGLADALQSQPRFSFPRVFDEMNEPLHVHSDSRKSGVGGSTWGRGLNLSEGRTFHRQFPLSRWWDVKADQA